VDAPARLEEAQNALPDARENHDKTLALREAWGFPMPSSSRSVGTYSSVGQPLAISLLHSCR
jgi:hypothetical protein